MTENVTNQVEEPLTPKKKRAMLEYLGILFAVAFLLVAVSLLVKVNSMQEDLDAANTGARENITSMESILESVRHENADLQTTLERSNKATELLALSQAALADNNNVAFHGYMAELEGYADTLPEAAAKIYAELTEHLQ